MGTIDYLAGEDSVVSYRLGKTLEELGAAARSMRLLADTLQQQPESVIFGKKKMGGSEMKNSLFSATVKTGLGICLLLLVGCSSSPTARHYVLSPLTGGGKVH